MRDKTEQTRADQAVFKSDLVVQLPPPTSVIQFLQRAGKIILQGHTVHEVAVSEGLVQAHADEDTDASKFNAQVFDRYLEQESLRLKNSNFHFRGVDLLDKVRPIYERLEIESFADVRPNLEKIIADVYGMGAPKDPSDKDAAHKPPNLSTDELVRVYAIGVALMEELTARDIRTLAAAGFKVNIPERGEVNYLRIAQQLAGERKTAKEDLLEKSMVLELTERFVAATRTKPGEAPDEFELLQARVLAKSVLKALQAS